MTKLSEINVLLTGVGAPGAPGIIKSLRLVNERNISIIGVDSDIKNSIGRGLVDKFSQISNADDPNFIEDLLDISKKNKVDVIVPLVTKELFKLSLNSSTFSENGIKVIVSDYDKLKLVNNKYELMNFAKQISIPVPDFRLVDSIEDFISKCYELGYPEKTICFKPPISNGMRGFRILNDSEDKMNSLINEKPNNVFIGFNEFINIARQSSYFPELLLMEYLPGQEYSVDALANGKQSICVIPRTREKIKMGISFVGETIFHKEIINYSEKIIEHLGLFGNIGFQFKEDEFGKPKIIESNPRVQGTIILCTASGYNMVYNAIKIALNEKPIQYKIDWNVKMIRYWDEIFIKNSNSFRL